MAIPIELLDSVALTSDAPELGLRAGEVGAVVEISENGELFEVEFSDDSGTTYGSHTLMASQLVPLHTRGQTLRLMELAQRITPSREELRKIRAKTPPLTFNYDGEPG